ncbi:unnamed protein product [Didymodactylos carnosus]|uniref:Microbial-type PARG catalytic domain-containing protein n=1 Tax=Didymodactylos carnosus TaxID=1234261 RepID=A0A814NWW6_9BILA|nr:unnamed protein product [Didymodactylos carnosus]CAF3862620.1 unnamed protein product [Didymodactylos carnosus]
MAMASAMKLLVADQRPTLVEEVTNNPMYVPCSALGEREISSIVQIAFAPNDADCQERVDKHGARKVMLKYLLVLKAINDERILQLVEKCYQKRRSTTSGINWNNVQQEYDISTKTDLFKRDITATDGLYESYWEIRSDSTIIDVKPKEARKLLDIHRGYGFQLEELKVYFNYIQIDNIPYANSTVPGFSDADAQINMKQFPTRMRQNAGQIHIEQSRIEQAVFSVPEGKQVIVLDFADERMPGGLFLFGATTQEETICYNSDLYRALMDYKYKKFNGGFMIPEYGVLYIKNVTFFATAAACYDLTKQHGLYRIPSRPIESTREKFRTLVRAAQANSDGDGSNTYLILGPIGTGAFKNDVSKIAELFNEELHSPLNGDNNTQQRHAFDQVWFVSSSDEKINVFQATFKNASIKKAAKPVKEKRGKKPRQ